MNATDDWYDVERVADDAWRITEGDLFSSFLVEGTDRALLIDAGAGIGDLRGVVESLVDVPVTLLLTHDHWDHVGKGAQFDDVIADEREHDDGRVVAEPITYGPAEWLVEQLEAGNEIPDGVDPETFELDPITGIETVEPGTELDLGGKTVELLHTPGHSPGHLAVLDREAGILYGGDVVHTDLGLYVHLEGCDARAYVDTFDRLAALWDEGAFDTLHPAHAPPLTGDDLTILATFRDGLREVLADEREYEVVEEGIPARRYEIAGGEVLTKPDVA